MRRLLPAVPIVALTIALAAAAPSFAADSMRILSPLSGTTVSGDLLIDGTITTGEPVDLTVGLAPQSLGECGSLVVERGTSVAESSTFSFTLDTQILPNGVYCVVAIADGGSLSHVVGDVTLENGGEFVEQQLPTLSVEGAEGATDAPPGDSTTDAAGDPFADISGLAPVVFTATAALALLVLVFAYVARRRFTD